MRAAIKECDDDVEQAAASIKVAIVWFLNYLSGMQELPPIFTVRMIDHRWWIEAPTDDPLRREFFQLLLRQPTKTDPRGCGEEAMADPRGGKGAAVSTVHGKSPILYRYT